LSICALRAGAENKILMLAQSQKICPPQFCGLATPLGTRRDKHLKKLEAMNGTLRWQVFIASPGIENDQTMFFHVTVRNVKFTVCS